ncbi:MAG: DMT family transporter [Actinomycetota bacterium]|nr:DMT family transporter [Actinomycetota bacterium]
MVYFLAICAAVLYSLAAFVQHREAQKAPAGAAFRLSLLSRLARRPIWIIGVALDLLAFLAQFLALKGGSLLLVQPILAFGLTSTLVLEAVFGARRGFGRVAALSLLSAAALAVFLFSTNISSTNAIPSAWWGLIIGAVAVGGFFAFKWFFGDLQGRARGAAMGLSVGLLHGAATFVIKAAANAVLVDGVLGSLDSWPVYGLVVVGAIDLILTQSAFQSSPLSVTMPLITILEPTVAMLMGVAILHESVSSRLGGVFLAVNLAAMAAIALVISVAASRLVEAVEEEV